MTVNELKKDLKEKTPTIGLDRTIKELKKENVTKVYIASGCKGKEDVKKLAEIYGAKFNQMEENSKELGVLCKKPFAISVLCFTK